MVAKAPHLLSIKLWWLCPDIGKKVQLQGRRGKTSLFLQVIESLKLKDLPRIAIIEELNS